MIEENAIFLSLSLFQGLKRAENIAEINAFACDGRKDGNSSREKGSLPKIHTRGAHNLVSPVSRFFFLALGWRLRDGIKLFLTNAAATAPVNYVCRESAHVTLTRVNFVVLL